MIAVSSAAQVRELDRRMIEDVGLPGIALMEVASLGVARSILAQHRARAARGTVVACGAGNNGGDGWAVARWLAHWGLPVKVWPVAPPKTADARIMADVARKLGVGEVSGPGDASLLVDAVFGTGLSRPVEGRAAEALAQIRDHGAPVVALDVPSGLDADRGVVLGVCAPAVRTVTIGRLKPGLLAAPELAGVVQLVDIGLEAVATAADHVAEQVEAADLAPLWPRRGQTDHKHRSGHLLVVAGSAAMAGAAELVCRGALAAGAGLITLWADPRAADRLGRLPPEVMVRPEADPSGLVRAAEGFQAVAAGPGLAGGQPLTAAWSQALTTLWRECEAPVVFDADALPCAGVGGDPERRVLTPHPGEAGRLLGTSSGQVQGDRLAAVRQLAERGTALLKGHATAIASGTGAVSLNPTGAPALGTAGSGDVLTGIVGALLARGCGAADAARLGAWAHGRAGEILTSRQAEGVRASQIAQVLPEAVGELLGM
ncbi:MAG: NAD(P)H-hydrate dehydratase [Myxococcales bacterium]|nr:NAD(P)H-hydrate dehydratase [Myxococcales bacterium]